MNDLSPNVNALCGEVWQARDAGNLTTDTRLLWQQFFVAVAADVAARAGYNPGEDVRVEWLREVIEARRKFRPHVRPEADQRLEDNVEWLLYERAAVPCGKDRAAGVDR